MTGNAHWLLRLALASVFLYHGLEKFFVMGIGGFATMMGLPEFVAALVALAEVAGGGLILIGGVTTGIVTRLGALATIPVMLGAIFMVHLQSGFRWSFTPSETHPLGGAEFQVVLVLIALYFLIVGNGDEAA